MHGKSLRRVLRLGSGTLDRLPLYILGACNALLVPLLVFNLGLIVQLLVGHGESPPPRDLILGPWVSGKIVDWPVGGRADVCLLVLTAAGVLLSLLYAVTQWMFFRSTARASLRAVSWARTEIRKQAFRLGPDDLLGGGRTRPEKLFTDECDVLVKTLMAWWRAFPRAAFTVVALIALAVALQPWLALLSILLAIVIWRTRNRLRGWSDSRGRYWEDRAKIHLDRLLDDLDLSPLASGYGLPGVPSETFQENLARYQRELLNSHVSVASMRALMLLTHLMAATLITLIIGFNVVARPSGMSVAGSVVLGVSLVCAYFPLAQFTKLPKTLREGERAANEILTFLDRSPAVGQSEHAKPLERLRQSIEFQRVTLADRAGNKLLNDVSFTIPAGKTIAVLSSERQAPIAMAGLLVRYYDPTSGRICFDGREISNATLDTVRGQSALVMQRGAVFTGTVSENIACGDVGFTALQITEAAQQARVFDVVQGLPDGFNTVIGNHEVRLEPHQALRVALARALLRNPSLIVLEEPAATMDNASAADFDSAIQHVVSGRTLIILPTRLSTLRAADQILLLHDGNLQAQGTHSELLQKSELYRHINYVRFNPFRNVVV